MSKYKSLQQALQQLEQHRTILSENVVDILTEAVHRELARLEMEHRTSQQRRLVSFLFLDVVSSTKTFEKLDPEDVLVIMDDILRVFGDCVEKHGGFVARLMGDALLAFFGAPISHEDDAERAVRAGLDIIKVAKKEALRIDKDYGVPDFQIRVGINIGQVALGEVGGAGMEYTAMGDAINVAKHTEAAAPPSGLLITHDTYRHIRGIFDVDEADKLQFKGREEMTLTYVVKYAKPRSFHPLNRSVEGIEIPMIGRDAEMETLKGLFNDATEALRTHIVTVTGDAGVGKSRLLAEFDYWVETVPGSVRYLGASANPQNRNVPFNLFHELLLTHFGILDDDHIDTMMEKVSAGFSETFTEEQAHIMAQFVGMEFHASPHVAKLEGNQRLLHDLGASAIADFFEMLCTTVLDEDNSTRVQPTIVFFDDIQWADPGSLELLEYIAQEFPNLPLMFVCMARPQLYDFQPTWGDALPHFTRIDLKTLSETDSKKMLEIMLQKVNKIPTSLSKLIIQNADGNPFYIEELIHMLIEDGIIIKGEEHWWLEKSRLKNLNVPPTLTGVIQARIDKLPRNERALLQRAAVIGQIFWSEALEDLSLEDEISIGIPPETIEDLQSHHLVIRHSESAFDGTNEFVFKSAILRDVAYESVLKRQRNGYHERVAEWLVKHASDRIDEYVSLIAEHYLLSGNREQAIPFLLRAADIAFEVGDYKVAIRDLEQVVQIGISMDIVERIEMIKKLGRAYMNVGDIRNADKCLNDALELAKEIDDKRRISRISTYLGDAAIKAGQYQKAQGYLEVSLLLAREVGDPETLAFALMRSGTLQRHEGNYEQAIELFEESQTYFEQVEDKSLLARVYRKLGTAAVSMGNFEQAAQAFEKSLKVCGEIADDWCKSNALNNLGDVQRWLGHLKAAMAHYQEALEIADRICNHQLLAILDLNMAHIARELGEGELAQEYYRQALHQSKLLGIRPVKLNAVVGLAGLKANNGDNETALSWLGMAMHHPSLNPYVEATMAPILERIKNEISTDELHNGLQAGLQLDLEAIVNDELAYRIH